MDESVRKNKGGGKMLEKNAPKKKADVAPVIDWIPCSERLPDKSDFYMVCAYNGDTYDYRKNWFYHEDDYGDSEWRGLIPYEKVIAWAPLPEPYLESEDTRSLTSWRNKVMNDFMKGAGVKWGICHNGGNMVYLEPRKIKRARGSGYIYEPISSCRMYEKEEGGIE